MRSSQCIYIKKAGDYSKASIQNATLVFNLSHAVGV